jgi:alkylation response protein AidB-like acyl-CoA dehydrogenase
MNIQWSAAELAFRDEVRAFLDAELPQDLREIGRNLTSVYGLPEQAIRWQKILHRKGWVAPAWPVQHGGCGWDLPRRYIFACELARAGAPPLSPMGLGMCGPVLMAYGTAEQQARFLPPMLSGDDFWCQGYSEPGSGSDLASLQMSARADGDDFICNGHKIWTTHAHAANWIFCLVRTSSEDIPQKGITFLLIDMTSPGVEVRPVISLSGEHIQNEIFFTDVRVPRANAVGQIGKGWTVAKYLMEFERGGSAYSPSMVERLERIRRFAADPSCTPDERPWASAGFRARFHQAEIAVETLAQVELRVMSGVADGKGAGPAASMLKTVATELSQTLTELAVEAVGSYAAAWQPHSAHPGGASPAFTGGFEPVGPAHCYTAVAKYFNDRAGTIYAGTNEIQRNIMAKAVLGL